MSSDALRLEKRDDGIALVIMDVPGEPQNTLKAEFSAQFDALFADIAQDNEIRAVVFTSGKKGTFLAGADVKMLQAATSVEEAINMSRSGQQAFSRLSTGKPVVAAINGACLGGGLELALACHGRVCSDNPKTLLALPEVQLGLLPGAGGTQRLPRLIGITAALDMMLTGRNIRPKKALKMGLVDEVVPETILVDVAIKHAKALIDGKSATKKQKESTSEKAQKAALEDNPVGRKVLFSQARKKLLAQSKGNYPAPEHIVTCIETGFAEGFEQGLATEARLFGELVMSPESAALRSIFFATTALKKDSGVDDPKVEARPLKKLGMLGAGLMGSGISFVSTTKAKMDVRLKDRDDKGVMNGLAAVKGLFDKRVKRKAYSKQKAGQLRSRITGTIDYSGFEGCDVVIEAVFEDINLKHQMVREVEAVCGPETIFASNTSSLPITQIAEASSRPETVIGMHYFSPVEKMPLLEIITTEHTADWVTASCVALGKKQGKTVIVVRDGVGFYTTRILSPYMNESVRLLAEGVAIDDIDNALTQWGFPVGPITLADEVGLDVGEKVGHIMIDAFGARMEPPESMQKLVADGRKGRKNKKGFYTYNSKKKEVDSTVYDVLGITPSNKMNPVDIAERCALLFINEAVLCLSDGILRSPRDGDIGAIFGLGFPPFRGGPFRYVDNLGAAAVVRKMERFAEKCGPRFTPAPLLIEMAEKGQKFYND